MNIILVVSDTFRRDHLTCYGNEKIIAPNLDAFAQKALIFEDCYCSSFPTVPARADLMTGRYTFAYLPWGPLPQDEITLADCLANNGYATAGIADTPFFARNGYGLDRGFDEFIYIRGQLSGTELDWRHLARGYSEERGYCAPHTLKEAADWLLRHHDKKFFLYIDTWDPHEPWDPPSYYVKPYYPGYQGEIIVPSYWDYREDGYTERDLEIAHACYCGEITMVDFWFGFLMERIRVLGLLDNTAILFTSDHGFSFGEHGQFGKRRFRWADNLPLRVRAADKPPTEQPTVHRSPLHNELIQVPLLMYLPGTKSRRIPGLMSLPDLMPTILELAGAPAPQRVQSSSILPLIRDEAKSIHKIVISSSPFQETMGEYSKTVDDQAREVIELSPCTITDGTWDLLYSVHGQSIELYHTRDDPGHCCNVFEEETEHARILHAEFVANLEKIETMPVYLEPRREF